MAIGVGATIAGIPPIRAQETPPDPPPPAAAATAAVWEGRAFVEAAMAEANLVEHYDWLRRSLVSYRDFFKGRFPESIGGHRVLSTVDRQFADPLSQIDETRAITDPLEAAGERDDVAKMLGVAANALDLPGGASSLVDGLPARPAAGASLEAYLDYCEAVLTIAKARLDAAFAGLSAGQLRLIRTTAPHLFDHLRRNVYLEFAPEAVREHVLEFIRLAGRVKLDETIVAGRIVGQLADREFLAQMAADLAHTEPNTELAFDGVDGPLVAIRQTAFGPIIVGGHGPNTYALEASAALIIDLGGDDRYGAGCASVGHVPPGTLPQTQPNHPDGSADATTAASDVPGISVVLDLAGNDVYETRQRPGVAGAVGGIALIADLAGDDTYTSFMQSQAFAAYGVSMLVDFTGNDTYRADCFSQGTAIFGVGILYDRDGNDHLTGAVYCGGVGLPQGFGLYYDRLGDDVIRASGEFASPPIGSTYGTQGQYHGKSLGCGVGFRAYPGRGFHEIAGGGIGVLLNGDGNDTYSAGEFSMAIGYFFGYGIFKDSAGNDSYTACRYGIATGAHQAVSCFIDDSGNDVYRNNSVAAIAGNWDVMVCTFFDGGGDDVYECDAGLSLGSATITSFALFYDAGGTDTYRAGGANSIGAGGHESDARRNTMSIGIFIDRGKNHDQYRRPGRGEPRANGIRNLQVTHHGDDKKVIGAGLFVDEADASTPEDGPEDGPGGE